MEKPMQYAYAVYKEKSFSKAAEKLYISQPALSAIIRKLEESLEAPLFDRSTKPISLTPAGEYYISCTEQIMNIERGMQDYFADLADCNTGKIRIGASSYFCSSVLPEYLQEFRMKYPNITCELAESNSTAVLKEQLLSREIDFAMTSNTYPASEYEELRLEQETILLAVPKGMMADDIAAYAYSYDEILQMIEANTLQSSNNRFVSLLPFIHEKFITIDVNSDLVPRIINMFKEVKAVPEFRMHLQQMSSCYYMAAGGFGPAFIRSSTLHTVKDTGKLQFYLPDSPLSVRDTRLYYKKGTYISHAMEAFLGWMNGVHSFTASCSRSSE